MVGKTVSHYKVLSKLGGGGMGVVYKAEDIKLKRPVALKFLPPDLTRDEDAKKRFVHEAQAASALEHQNICNIYEIDETGDGQLFIAMACYDGETLKKKMESGSFRTDEALDIAVQVAKGLERAHEEGIVHRDIKPANVMVTRRGEVKIVDFGLAKLSGQTRLTKSGSTVGTIAYMSPEQARGEDVDHRTDIWSLGVMLYEMTTGELPFKGEYEQAVVYSILNESPKPVSDVRPDVPMELERVIEVSLAKNPDERYRDAGEMLKDLRDVDSGKRLGAIGERVPSLESSSKSIAVLALKSLSDSKEDEYFSDGITEDILTHLSKISDLRVISRTSSLRYKNTEKGIREIGRELNVATILEGSVRRVGERVRIASQLIDVKTDEHLWAETYDREMKDIFEIQSDVAQNIAAALKARLSPDEKERIERKPTQNLTAYDYYLKGRELYYRYRSQDNESAIELFKKALELDPGFALAHAGLGDAYAQKVDRFGFDRTWIESAIAASEKAVAIDPSCAEAHKALGLANIVRGHVRRALGHFRRAVELNPNLFAAVISVAIASFNTGELTEAVRLGRRAIATGPTNAFGHFICGCACAGLGDFERAEPYLQDVLRLHPSFPGAYVVLVYMPLMRGEYQRAAAVGKKALSAAEPRHVALCAAAAVELFREDYDRALEYYDEAMKTSPGVFCEVTDMSAMTRSAYIYWKKGQQGRARNALQGSLDRLQERLDNGDEVRAIPYEISAIHAIQDRKEEAHAWLQRAIDAGFRDYRLAMADPVFENIRGEMQFQKMMAEVKGMVDEMRRRAARDETVS
ncbi:MAG: protein kinase [Candidatus Eiseniibacteriota bacterium]|nr:MAG: protein kinase [Candidatus Eisenbacteria bacterium]